MWAWGLYYCRVHTACRDTRYRATQRVALSVCGFWRGSTPSIGLPARRSRRMCCTPGSSLCLLVRCPYLPFPAPSFIIGLSLGVNTTDKTGVLALLIALAFHQWLEVRGRGRGLGQGQGANRELGARRARAQHQRGPLAPSTSPAITYAMLGHPHTVLTLGLVLGSVGLLVQRSSKLPSPNSGGGGS